MGITINGLETRFQKPKGGENPFKSAKPFDDNIDYNSLEDGDLFYIESKEGWKEVNYWEGFLRTMPENVTQSLPQYINKSDLSLDIHQMIMSNADVDEDAIIKGYQHLIGPGKQNFLTKVKQLVYKKDYKLYNTISQLITAKNNTSWQA